MSPCFTTRSLAASSHGGIWPASWILRVQNRHSRSGQTSGRTCLAAWSGRLCQRSLRIGSHICPTSWDTFQMTCIVNGTDCSDRRPETATPASRTACQIIPAEVFVRKRQVRQAITTFVYLVRFTKCTRIRSVRLMFTAGAISLRFCGLVAQYTGLQKGRK